MNEIVLGIVLFVAIVLILSSVVVAARALLVPSGPVRLRVNSRVDVSGKAGRKLLEILSDGGVPVPAACGGKGTCGQCRVTLGEQAEQPLPIELARLTRREMNQGIRLACQVTVRGDLEVRVDESILGARNWLCRVASTRMLSPLIREIVFELPAEESLDFRAGSYVLVTAPPHEVRYADLEIAAEHGALWDRLKLRSLVSTNPVETTRAYSLANPPADRNRIVLLVRLALPPPTIADAPPGVVSSWLFSLKPGDQADLAGTYGDFHARDSEREMVIIGGGVGMAPLRSIILDQLERRQTARHMSFWYGARSRADLFYSEELDALAARYPNFRWTAALSEPSPGDPWEGAVGFVHDVVLRQYLSRHAAPEDCEYYLCGPPLMLGAVLEMLDDLGVEPDSIFFDDFGA